VATRGAFVRGGRRWPRPDGRGRATAGSSSSSGTAIRASVASASRPTAISSTPIRSSSSTTRAVVRNSRHPGSGWRWNARRRSLSLARASWDIRPKAKRSGYLTVADSSPRMLSREAPSSTVPTVRVPPRYSSSAADTRTTCLPMLSPEKSPRKASGRSPTLHDRLAMLKLAARDPAPEPLARLAEPGREVADKQSLHPRSHRNQSGASVARSGLPSSL